MPRAPVGSKEWQRVAGDPLVERVKEAVDGTLFDVRPAEPKPPPRSPTNDAEVEDNNY